MLLSMLYYIIYSTKRVDHSNTRLASQLDRNPGSFLSLAFFLVVAWGFLVGFFLGLGFGGGFFGGVLL